VVTAGLALLTVSACSLLPSNEPERDAEGAITAEAATDAFSLAVGDCIDDPGVENVSDIRALPCDQPHVFEAFAGTDMPDGDYPGDAAANTAASTFCAREFASFIGLEYDASMLKMLYFYPVEESWKAMKDREILCFVAEKSEAPVRGTLRDSRR
jgi:hypothetical protein